MCRSATKVKKGDVLCIIEAMKLMNEITAEQDGEIVDICVKSGEVVEYSPDALQDFLKRERKGDDDTGRD